MSDDDRPEGIEFTELRYIKLKGGGSKQPIEQWGGYDQNFDDAPKVYAHEWIGNADHGSWGICGIEDQGRASRALLIFDLDIHKADDDFDVDRVEVPDDTAVVKSQSGGIHIYFAVTNCERGEGMESDFAMTADPGWDIDIRGSFVNHHVVAPGEIPYVDTDYEVVNDEAIVHVTDPRDAAERIRLDGDPLIEYSPETGINGGEFEFDRSGDPPDDMPTCYQRGLQLRATAPDDHPNTHKVNTLTALCGLAAGYSVDDMVDHFVEDFAPGNSADERETRYQLTHMAGKIDRGSLAAPAVSTLRDWGILGADETCDCDIEYHGSGSDSPSFDIIDELPDNDPPTDMSDTDTTDAGHETGSESEIDTQDLFQLVNDTLRLADEDEITNKTAIHRVALAISNHEHFIHPPDDARGWRSVLYRYDENSGVYRPDGERHCSQLAEQLLGDFASNQQINEVIGKITRRAGVPRAELGTEPYLLVVDNGVLDLRDGTLEPWSPDYYERSKIPVEYHEDAECPRIDEFFREIVQPGDVPTLYQLAAHSIYGEYIDEKAAMLVGDGQNGKSVYLDLLETFLGDRNVSHRSLQELAENDYASNNLQGKFANYHPDMSDDTVTDLGMFKKLTGRDTMQANVKYEKPVKFENYATLIFAANTMPQMAEDTHALWRRWIYINFPHEFNDAKEDAKDETPKRVLMRELTQDSELQGVLSRCVDELSAWWDGRDLFDSVMNAEQVREKMKRASEPVFDFATACLEADDGGYVSKTQAREAYQQYAREEGLPSKPENVFGEDLMGLSDYPIESGQRRENGSQITVYKGVSFTPRGRQVLGLDAPEDDQQGDLNADNDGGPRGREDGVLDSMRDLGADGEPISKAMIFGRATAHGTSMKQAEFALDDLKDKGRVYQPPEADDNEWMISE